MVAYNSSIINLSLCGYYIVRYLITGILAAYNYDRKFANPVLSVVSLTLRIASPAYMSSILSALVMNHVLPNSIFCLYVVGSNELVYVYYFRLSALVMNNFFAKFNVVSISR